MKINLTPLKYTPAKKEVAVKDSSKQAALERFIRDNYNPHINVMNGKLYNKKGNNMQELSELNLLRECRLMEIPNASKQRIMETILADNFCPKFNPIEHYLKNLPEWKGENDEITKLASFVKLANEKEDRIRFEKHFKKMFIRSVACGLGLDYNKHVLVFIGGQHKGKTSFCEYLCPEPLRPYMETILPNQTIDEKAIALKFWAVMDEMGRFSPRQLEANKATLVLKQVHFKFFDKYEQTMTRHCNFIATTNYTEIFNDETGNSRFLPFEITDIDWKGYKENVEINACWAQAYKMQQMILKAAISYNYNLDDADIIENDRASMRYNVSTPAINWIMQYFDVPDDKNDARAEFIHATDIVNYFELQKNFRREDRLNFSEKKIGTAMNLLKFPRGQKYYSNKGYQLKGYYIIKKNIEI